MMTTTYGVGTIYQRKSDGRWLAAVDLPRRKHEPRIRRTFTGTTREAVEAKLAAYRSDNPAPEFLGRAVYNEQARAQGTHTAAEWYALCRASKCRCHYCGIKCDTRGRRERDDNLEQDHKIPVSRGGSDSIDNIVVACRACNAEKGTMTADEYAAWKVDRP